MADVNEALAAWRATVAKMPEGISTNTQALCAALNETEPVVILMLDALMRGFGSKRLLEVLKQAKAALKNREASALTADGTLRTIGGVFLKICKEDAAMRQVLMLIQRRELRHERAAKKKRWIEKKAKRMAKPIDNGGDVAL